MTELIDKNVQVTGSALSRSEEALTSEMVAERKQKMAWIARVFSRTYSLTVVPSEHGGWSAGLDNEHLEEVEKYVMGQRPTLDGLPNSTFHPTQIHYDEKEVATKPEDEVLGVLRHEVGHVNNTDYRLFLEGQRWAQEQGVLPSTYAMAINYPEDVWVNIREIEDSTVVEQQMKTRYAASTAEIIPHVSTQPITHQLGLNVIYYWLTGENLPTLKDERVRSAFEQIKPALEEYFYGATPADNHKLFREKIWPTFKVLEAQAQKDEAKDQIKQNLQQEQKGQGQGQQGQGQERRGQGKGQQSGEEIGNNPGREATQKLPQDLKRELEKSLRGGQQGGSEDQQPGELSPEQEAALEKAIEQLPEDLKQRLMAKAREELDRKQSETLNKELPKLLRMEKDQKTGEYKAHLKGEDPKNGQKTAAELEKMLSEMETGEMERLSKESQAQQTRDSERRSKEGKMQEKTEMLRAGFDEQDLEHYRRYQQLEAEILPYTRRFIDMIDPYVPKKYRVVRTGRFITGSRPDSRTAAQRIPVGDYRILKRKEVVDLPEALLYATLLIDNSSSMSGEKMEVAIKTAIFFAQVFKHYEMPFAIKLFGSQTEQIMDFTQPFDEPRYAIKKKLVTMTNASGESTDLDSGITKALEETSEAQRIFPESFGAIFTISDGRANAGRTGQELKDYIGTRKSSTILKAFALAQDPVQREQLKRDLAFYFGEENVAVPETFGQLPESAFQVLRNTLLYVSRMRQI